jgi:hypothetical protein
MRGAKYIYVFGCYTNLNTPPQFFPLVACAQGLPPLSPLIGASPRFPEISRRFRGLLALTWFHFHKRRLKLNDLQKGEQYFYRFRRLMAIDAAYHVYISPALRKQTKHYLQKVQRDLL